MHVWVHMPVRKRERVCVLICMPGFSKASSGFRVLNFMYCISSPVSESGCLALSDNWDLLRCLDMGTQKSPVTFDNLGHFISHSIILFYMRKRKGEKKKIDLGIYTPIQ